MLLQAIGLVELISIARGIVVADAMLKAADVDLIEAKCICPGKFIVMVCGEISAVQSSVDVGRNIGADAVADDFILANVHPAVIRAAASASEVVEIGALGSIETFSVASLLVAADTAVKAANVELIEIRMGMGIGGKSFVTLTGDVSSVKAAVEAGASGAKDKGMLVEQIVIPSLHPQLKRLFS